MTKVIGFTHKELIELMLSNDIHCSVDRFKTMAAAIQQKALGAVGPAVEMRVVDEEMPRDHVWDLNA